MSIRNVLVVNAGSSSLKFMLFDMSTEQMLAKGQVERIGIGNSLFSFSTATFSEKQSACEAPDHAAAVKLALQGDGGFRIGDALLAGRDQSGNAPFQFRVGGYGQPGLANEGAAHKNLPGDAQQRFAAIGAGEVGHRLTGTGIEGAESAHGCGGPCGGPHESQVPAAVVNAVQAALHGAAVPGSVAVFLGDAPGLVPLPAADAVEHGGEKSTPGGLAAFVGGLQNIQTVLQLQGLLFQTAEVGRQTMEFQNDPSQCEYTI